MLHVWLSGLRIRCRSRGYPKILNKDKAEHFIMTQSLQATIGFIGAGRMAQALARGFVEAGLVAAASIRASDPFEGAREAFAELVPGSQTSDNNAGVVKSDVIFLAVKPQQMESVLGEISEQIDASQLVVSIAAGVRLSKLAAGLGEACRLVRVMPNTPCLVGQSASAYCLGGEATPEDGQLVSQLLSAVGVAFELPEEQLDAVTGLSGSGPAFVCVMIEALTEGGVKMGLSEEVASALAVATIRGTGALIQESGDSPVTVRERVSSPGGTTLAGLAALEEHKMRSAVIAAVDAATRRSVELGE